jgi:hypothetical protein
MVIGCFILMFIDLQKRAANNNSSFVELDATATQATTWGTTHRVPPAAISVEIGRRPSQPTPSTNSTTQINNNNNNNNNKAISVPPTPISTRRPPSIPPSPHLTPMSPPAADGSSGGPTVVTPSTPSIVPPAAVATNNATVTAVNILTPDVLSRHMARLEQRSWFTKNHHLV